MVWKAFGRWSPVWSHFTFSWSNLTGITFIGRNSGEVKHLEMCPFCVWMVAKETLPTENLRQNGIWICWHFTSISSDENVNHLVLHCDVAANALPICWGCNGLCLQMFSSIGYLGMGRQWDQKQQALFVLHQFTVSSGTFGYPLWRIRNKLFLSVLLE